MIMITAAVPTAKKPITPDIRAPLARQIISRHHFNIIFIYNKSGIVPVGIRQVQHKALI